MAEEPVSMETNDDVVMTETSDIHSPNELAEVEIDEARKYYEAKDYKLALVSYSNAIALCPDVAKYYGNRAACYMMLDRYRDAVIDARTSVELDPNFVKGYIRVIRCCLKLGEIVEAETTLNKLSQLDPTHGGQSSPEAADLLHVKRFVQEAHAAMEIKDYRKVVYCMDRCCDISRYCIRFKLTKAECLAYLGRYQDAQEIANDILLLDRSNIDATYVRGICLYHQDNVDKAFMHFQEVLRLAPDHTKALEIYKRAKKLMQTKEAGNAHFKSGKYQEAYDLYTEALTIDPENKIACTKLHYNRALTAAKLGRLNESISECTEALNIDENYQKAILKRASCYMQLQEYEEAVRDYERVCRINKSRDNRRLLMEAKEALKRSKKKDYYKILGVEKTASIDDIKKAYRKRALVHHPDRHSSASDTEKKEQEKKFKEIGEAYTILSDPKKRARYDRGGDMDEFENGFEYARYQESPFEAFFNKSDGGFKFQYSGGRENFPF